MSKVSNVILMLEYLSTGKKYSIQELSDLLEVSPRMIRIYKDELEKAGIFVDTLKGIYGGYVLEQNINIPYLLFDNNDIEIIRKCVSLTTDDILKDKLTTIEKRIATNVLKQENSNKAFINEDSELNVYNKLNRAIREHHKVKINYVSLQHGESIRTIYPLGMYLFHGEWWCSCYQEEKDDMRQFHIKQIKDCEILTAKFEPREINFKF